MADTIPADMVNDDPYCVCCCRPLSEHNEKRQCPETSYFVENDLGDAPTPSSADNALREALEKCRPIVEVYAVNADDYSDAEIYGEAQDALKAIDAALASSPAAEAEPVAYRYVHLDYAGRKISRYGTHAERVNGRDPIEVHPLYAAPISPTAQQATDGRRAEIRQSTIRQLGDDPHADRIILPGTDWDIVLAALSAQQAAADEGVSSDATIAAKARAALELWLAWPDGLRDGWPTVTNEQVESWLFVLPNHLAGISTPTAQQATDERECPSSPDGRHQVDTSMESGPNNCFHCERPMRKGGSK
jgi:hypothetical protein